MGTEIRTSQSCSVVCYFGELNPLKQNILASQMEGGNSKLWTSVTKWEDGNGDGWRWSEQTTQAELLL